MTSICIGETYHGHQPSASTPLEALELDAVRLHRRIAQAALSVLLGAFLRRINCLLLK
jgi:hypothetical protein